MNGGGAQGHGRERFEQGESLPPHELSPTEPYARPRTAASSVASSVLGCGTATAESEPKSARLQQSTTVGQ